MDNELKRVLNEIIDKKIIVPKKNRAYNSIRTIELIYGVNLPSDYKDFLNECGACLIKDDRMYQPIEITPVTPKDGFDSVGVFYGIADGTYDVISAIKIYMDILGSNVMPIADADGGDLICMGLKGKYKGKIYFWYHEEEVSNEDGTEYLYLIANSFKEFLLTFTHHKREKNVNLDDIELFLDDDLLNE